MINPNLLNNFIKVCERAAFGASKFKGKNDKIAADQAAVDEMRSELNKISFQIFPGYQENRRTEISKHFQDYREC